MAGFEDVIFRQVRDSCVEEPLKRVSDRYLQEKQNALKTIEDSLEKCSDHINELRNACDEFIRFIDEHKKRLDEIKSEYEKQLDEIKFEYKKWFGDTWSEYKEQLRSEYNKWIDDKRSEYPKRIDDICSRYDNQLRSIDILEERIEEIIDQYNEEQTKLQKISLLCGLGALC